MPGYEDRVSRSLLLQDPEGGHAGGQDRGLGVQRLVQGLRRPAEAQLGQKKAQGLISLGVYIAGSGVVLKQTVPHAHVLRALSWKQIGTAI
jgi:hypothetical protein